MMLKQSAISRRQPSFENPFFKPDDDLIKSILKNSMPNDPSMRSLGYIKMTSRRGLSCFQGQFSPILFSRHPNLDDTYIIYPSAKAGAEQDILDLSKLLKMSGDKVQIIRVPENMGTQWSDFFFKPALEESVLDYKYPVHILDIEKSLGMKGTVFLKFRNKINAIKKIKPYVKPLTFSMTEKLQMKQIVQEWAPFVFKGNFDKDVEYIHYALDNLTTLPNIAGLVAYIDDRLVGFTIWENPLSGDVVASSLIHCSIHERGLSEYLHYEMMKILHKEDVKYLSLGGAETAGLDAFKRKMNPVQSVQLKTITL